MVQDLGLNALQIVLNLSVQNLRAVFSLLCTKTGGACLRGETGLKLPEKLLI